MSVACVYSMLAWFRVPTSTPALESPNYRFTIQYSYDHDARVHAGLQDHHDGAVPEGGSDGGWKGDCLWAGQH